MKVQSINNYAVMQKPNQPTSKQQSFGKLIIDERGMEEHMTPHLKELVKKVFARIRCVFGEQGELKALAEQTERDVLVSPFQDANGGCGIALTRPHTFDSETICGTSYYRDYDLAPNLRILEKLGNITSPKTYSNNIQELGIVNALKYWLSPSETFNGTTFARAISENNKAFYDITMPLPEDMMRDRYALN